MRAGGCRRRKIANTVLALLLGVNAFATNVPVQAAASDQVVSANKNKIEQPSSQKTSDIYQDKTSVANREHYQTVGEMSQYMHDHNALGVASEFHLFGNEVQLNADTNGNIAANHLNTGSQNEAGTRNFGKYNASDGDLYYLPDVDSKAFKFRFKSSSNHVVMGKDAQLDKASDRSELRLTQHGKYFSIENNEKISADDVVAEQDDQAYLNINDELKQLAQKSEGWFAEKQSAGVKIEQNRDHDSLIDVSKAEADDHNLIIVDLDAADLQNGRNLTIAGLSANPEAQTVIINVCSQKKEFSWFSHMKLIYKNQQQVVGNSEDHALPNHLLWNFGTSMTKICFQNSPLLGSVLAVNSEVDAGQNIDGNIVADKIVVNGESHRWDLAPDWKLPEESEYPVVPRDPTDPQAEQPTKPVEPLEPVKPSQPTDPEKPVKPVEPPVKQNKPAKPDKPEHGQNKPKPHNPADTPSQPHSDEDQPAQPGKLAFTSEPALKPQHEEAVFPLLIDHFELAATNKPVFVKNANTQLKSNHQSGKATRSFSKSDQSVHQQAQTGLPQTGWQNAFALAGMALTAIAAGLYLTERKHD